MSEQQSKPYLTFRHLRLPWVSKSATVTAAIRINKEAEKAEVAFSFCSPEEKTFQKRVGRRIARTRLNGDRCLSVKLLDTEPVEDAVARGLREALIQRFVAKRALKTLDPFTHWFPNWFMRAVHVDTMEYTDPMDYPKRDKEDAKVFVAGLFHFCKMAYRMHLAEVKEKHERDAAEAAAKAHDGEESAGE